MLNKLIKLAESLDAQGFYAEADLIDEILKVAVENWQYYGFQSKKDYDDFRESKGVGPSEEKQEEVREVQFDEFEEQGFGNSSITLTPREQDIMERYISHESFNIKKTSYDEFCSLCNTIWADINAGELTPHFVEELNDIANKLKAYAKKYFDTIFNENDFDR